MYVVYIKETTQLISNLNGGPESSYAATEAAAKAKITRFVKANPAYTAADVVYSLSGEFHTIEKKMTVKSLMTGKDVEISVNTPWCCNPASETYWSM